MKRTTVLLILLAATGVWGQSSLQNFGNVQLHSGTQLGIYGDLNNQGNLAGESNSLIGFYGDNTQGYSGNPAFAYDMEVFNSSDLVVQGLIEVANNLNFIEGNILTDPNDAGVYLDFRENGFFTGEDDPRKIAGYAAISNREVFSFPVGDTAQLRPLLLESESNNDFAICTYLFENPSNPSSLNGVFDVDNKVRDIGAISTNEFWILQTEVPSRVTLSWNERSALVDLALSVEEIILVGWSKTNNQWIPIGNSGFSGDLNQGFLVSNTFTPSDYEVITFGSTPQPLDTFVVNNPTLGNYFISPNGDGTNDFLVFDNIDDLGDNVVMIYNKFGQKVFEMPNYTNEFNGVSNLDNFVLSRDIGLPEGVYYYMVELMEENLQYQGFFFLDR